jgi:putative peptidoglycan lipid II flippase
MVKKFIQLFHKEIGGLHEAAYLLALFAVASQLLGVVRDRLLASRFGAGLELDLYYAAFRIPDFIFVTVASLVSISVLVPFLSARLDRGKEEIREFISHTFSFFALLIVIVCAGAFVVAPYILPKIFPGFTNPADVTRLVLLSRILLLSPILLGISNFFASITQLYKRFVVYALTPVLYNLGIIIGIVFFAPLWGNIGIVWGVVLGAALHCLIQIPFIIREGLFPRLSVFFSFVKIREVVMLSVPRTVALATSHFATILLLGFASQMKEGSISIFNFSWNLQSVPLTIIGMSYSLAAFPVLSALFARGERDSFIAQFVLAARHIIFWSVPLSALFIVLRAQIVRTILGASTEFDWNDTRLTAAALALFTFSALAQSVILLFVRGFYAAGKTKAPLIINSLSAVVIVVSAYTLRALFEHSLVLKAFIENLFRVQDVSGVEMLVLPLGFTIGAIVNAVLLWIVFERNFRGFSRPVIGALYHCLAAAVIIGVVAYAGLNIFDDVFDLTTVAGVFLQGFCSGVLGIFAGVVMLKMLGNREVNEIIAALHRKIWKAKIIGPEPTENI